MRQLIPPLLISALEDSDRLVGAVATESLSKRGAMVTEELIVSLRSQNPEARAKAAFVLGRIKYPRALDPLIEALQMDDLRLKA